MSMASGGNIWFLFGIFLRLVIDRCYRRHRPAPPPPPPSAGTKRYRREPPLCDVDFDLVFPHSDPAGPFFRFFCRFSEFSESKIFSFKLKKKKKSVSRLVFYERNNKNENERIKKKERRRRQWNTSGTGFVFVVVVVAVVVFHSAPLARRFRARGASSLSGVVKSREERKKRRRRRRSVGRQIIMEPLSPHSRSAKTTAGLEFEPAAAAAAAAAAAPSRP